MTTWRPIAAERPEFSAAAPGAAFGLLMALVAVGVGSRLGLPAAVIALGQGLAIASLPIVPRLAPGLAVWARTGLRAGVALLGAQVVGGDIAALGPTAFVAATGIVATGVGLGAILGLALGMPLAEALIAAAAVSICGAAAAMAVSQALPDPRQHLRHTGLVVVGVNLLSTTAMIVLPACAVALRLSEHQAGLLFGLSIQDVAQAAGAGSAVSPAAERIAAIAKLSRVIWLGPVVVIASFLLTPGTSSGPAIPRLAPPPFLIAFVVLALVRNLVSLSPDLLRALAQLSQVLLAGAVFAVTASVPLKEAVASPRRLVVQLCGASAIVLGLSALAVVLL